ncbi:MAG: Benzaldehyde lyase [Acidimicrobiales bacterium]|nr:MAG: thiamine pyrophosphate-binding protein [Actinomycetota bacterium]MBV6509230.1 Benzaldehyde lyase [Acidimicrobiales bacterium]RIK04037.1 MAG: benzaldehyde lyase [Acidobacteriota bacterium]
MVKIDGGEMLVRMLEQEGIDTLFVLHGGHLDSILQAAARHDMRLIDTRHEQAAGHAADGWARTTGRTGVAVVTAGPGFTDCVTAIANAYLDCVPTLFISGAAPLREAETLPLQGGLDQVAIVEPITKWAHRVTNTHRIPDLVAQALRTARTGRPGPVYLEVPIDVLFSMEDEEALLTPQIAVPAAPPAPADEVVEKALALLIASERPAIYAGGGAWFSGAGPELLAFAEKTGIPVVMNSKARGMVPADHPHCGGGLATLAMSSMAGAGPIDCLLILGARLGMFTGGRNNSMIPPDASVIQVDIAPEEIGRNRDIQVGITADCREALKCFNAAATERDWPDRSAWRESIGMLRGGADMMFADALSSSEAPIHPYRLAHDVVAAIPPDAIVIADGGETATWMEMAGAPQSGGSWLSHGYLGCLGTGMPFAIAAQVAHPGRPVVCVVGDGSVGLNFSEFDTMARHDLPVVTVINNDQLWGMSAHGQDLIYGQDKRVVTELGPTRYDLAAAGFGCHAELVEEPAEISAAIERALASGKPACVNVMTDPSVISPITMMMVGSMGSEAPTDGEGGSITIPYYEDLDR